MSSHFSVTWLTRVALGLGLAAVSLQVAWIFGQSWWQMGVAGVVVALGGIGFAAFTEWRERQLRRVRKASRIVSLPASWTVKFGKRTPDGWTAAIAVIRDDGMRFIVDIRPWRDVGWSPDDGTVARAWLVDGHGKALRPDPLPRLQAAALASSAAPVLWLPQATEPGVHRHTSSNVLVVTGTPRDLKSALQSARLVKQTAAETPVAA